MIKEMGKCEGEESLKTRPKKLKNSRKPKGHAINPTDQHAPRGHVACGAATTHLIRNETPRVMDSSVQTLSSSMVVMTRHSNHRRWGATDGIDEPTSPR